MACTKIDCVSFSFGHGSMTSEELIRGGEREECSGAAIGLRVISVSLVYQ